MSVFGIERGQDGEGEERLGRLWVLMGGWARELKVGRFRMFGGMRLGWTFV